MKSETEYENKLILKLQRENTLLEAQASRAHQDFYAEREAHTGTKQWSRIMFWTWIVTLLCGTGVLINYTSLHKQNVILESRLHQLQPQVAAR